MSEQYRRPELGDWRVVIAFASASLACAYVTTVAIDTARIDAVFAIAPVALITGCFGWARRRYDILEVVLPSIIVAYAGYIGIAAARLPHMIVAPMGYWRFEALAVAGPLYERWPLVLLAGVPVALVVAIGVALPLSKIPGRRTVSHADDALWTFISERNAEIGAARSVKDPHT